RPSLDELADGVRRADRALLVQAITLIESAHPRHRARAQELLHRLLPATGDAQRVGITGVPGVGKSTFIEALGLRLAEAGRRVAVLAVDPSSAVSGGSILGDKTRMGGLSSHPNAFVRPSPSSGSLGGGASRTRETMLLCEAAGYEIVLIETVGVGQSEIVVAEMVDFLLLLLLPGGGDELQGIKRGILEHIDGVVVNKADGARKTAAREARAQYAAALRFVHPSDPHDGAPPVLAASAQTGDGLDAAWTMIDERLRARKADGRLALRRRRQRRSWLWARIDDGLREAFRQHPDVAAALEMLEADVVDDRVTPAHAAQRLIDIFRGADPDAR
ncbi:MAG: methylmalonyl Co-A mutase-associated GTPase MeaB, partial [Acidobacteriota bacterium]